MKRSGHALAIVLAFYLQWEGVPSDFWAEGMLGFTVSLGHVTKTLHHKQHDKSIWFYTAQKELESGDES